MRIAKNYKTHGDYGNPEQAELWVKWVMSVDEPTSKNHQTY
jgi:hypothetical protein